MRSKSIEARAEDAPSLIERVIAGGNCVGCGACAFANPAGFQMSIGSSGAWMAKISDPSPNRAELDDVGQICPMAGAGADETTLGAELYGDLPFDQRIGRYRDNLAVYVRKGNFRAAGSSGGFVSWLLSELLQSGEVDGVLHVRPSSTPRHDGLLFEYALSLTHDEIVAGAKSRYYPIEMSQVLKLIAEDDLTYAVVGVPCFIKAIRLLQKHGQIAPRKIRFCIGIVCGHLKSRYFGEYLAWQKGVTPKDLKAIDFRHKLEDRPASDYGFAISSQVDHIDQKAVAYPMRNVSGRDWGEGLFKIPACEYCDDVLAECADIAVGDAWLAPYTSDPRGTNVVTIRNNHLSQIVGDAAARGDLAASPIGADSVARSQASGLRHRREGLAHRLARRTEVGAWVPKKRVEPKLASNLIRRRLYDLREKIAVVSSEVFFQAKADGQLSRFVVGIDPLLKQYRRIQLTDRLLSSGPKKIFGAIYRYLRSVATSRLRPKRMTQ